MKDFDLRDLDAFVAVARTRNFRRAAVEQGVSVSSLSQRLRDMEERLGVRLMNRTTRSVALTDSGRRLLDAAGPGLGQALAALKEVAAQPGETVGRVRLSVPRTAVPFIIDPVVPAFRARHPRIEIEVAVQERLVDIVAEGFDAGVRESETIERDMVQVRLTDPFRFVWSARPATSRITASLSAPKTSCATSASRSARRRPGRSMRGSWSGVGRDGAFRFEAEWSRTTDRWRFRWRSWGLGSLTHSSQW